MLYQIWASMKLIQGARQSVSCQYCRDDSARWCSSNYLRSVKLKRNILNENLYKRKTYNKFNIYKVSLHLHAKPAIARALKVHVIQLSYIHTPAQTTTNRKHCPNPKPHLPFNQLIVSLISTDAVQVAPWSGIHSLKETPNPSPSMPLIVRDWWNCLLWPSTRSQNQLPLGSLCYLGSPCLTPCLLTVGSTLHGY